MGKTEIPTIDMDYRSMVERCYRNGEEVDEAAAFLLLLQDVQDREIARAYGLLPTEEEIDGLEKHVFNTSKARDILKAIQQVFGEDEAAYRRVFLEPKIIGQKLRAFQSSEHSAPKIPYEEWRRVRVLEIKVEVFDDTLVERVKKQYPHVWWLERLSRRHSRASGNPGPERASE